LKNVSKCSAGGHHKIANQLRLSISNTEAEITPLSGSGTTTLTITGKGAGYSDSEIRVEKEDIELATLTVKIHKPDKFVYVTTEHLTPPTNYIGAGNVYLYDTYDINDVQSRVIPNLEGYRIYERLHIDRNEDGLGGYWSSSLINEINCTPYPGRILSYTELIGDTVNIWIPEETTTQELDTDAIVQWHNSFYIMENYLKGSTARYTWTPIIEGENVVDLKLERTELNDSQKVTQANDDID